MNKRCILVTRPSPSGEKLCQLIRDQGHDAIHFPTIDIVPVEFFTSSIGSILNFDWIIFISPQAVYHFPLQSIPSEVKVAAVGLGTAHALEAKNIHVSLYPEEWSSEGLLKMPAFQHLAGRKVLIVKGEGGREVLIQTLEQQGVSISQAIVYRRTLPQVNIKPFTHLLQSHKIDIIVCTSSEGIKNLLQLFGKKNKPYLQEVSMLVVSERLKEDAINLGFNRIEVAKNANHQIILETLRKMYD